VTEEGGGTRKSKKRRLLFNQSENNEKENGEGERGGETDCNGKMSEERCPPIDSERGQVKMRKFLRKEKGSNWGLGHGGRRSM